MTLKLRGWGPKISFPSTPRYMWGLPTLVQELRLWLRAILLNLVYSLDSPESRAAKTMPAVPRKVRWESGGGAPAVEATQVIAEATRSERVVLVSGLSLGGRDKDPGRGAQVVVWVFCRLVWVRLCSFLALWSLARGLWTQYLYLHNEDKNAHRWAVVTVNGMMYGSPQGCARHRVSDRGLHSLVLASGVRRWWCSLFFPAIFLHSKPH